MNVRRCVFVRPLLVSGICVEVECTFAWRMANTSDSNTFRTEHFHTQHRPKSESISFSFWQFFFGCYFRHAYSIAVVRAGIYVSGENTPPHTHTHMLGRTHSPTIKQSYIFGLHGMWQVAVDLNSLSRSLSLSVSRSVSLSFHMNYGKYTVHTHAHNESFVWFCSTFR